MTPLLWCEGCAGPGTWRATSRPAHTGACTAASLGSRRIREAKAQVRSRLSVKIRGRPGRNPMAWKKREHRGGREIAPPLCAQRFRDAGLPILCLSASFGFGFEFHIHFLFCVSLSVSKPHFFPRFDRIFPTATLKRYFKGLGLGFRAKKLGLGLGFRAKIWC